MDADVRNTINEYFKSKPIQKACFFCSVARGDEHPDSDVDILVSLVPGAKMGFDKYLK